MNTKPSAIKAEISINKNMIYSLGRGMYNSNLIKTCVREAIQNSLDANSSKIDIFFDMNTGTLSIVDNGQGINQIENILTIGNMDNNEKITNRQDNTIGGFGLAKLAFFSARNFIIHSLNWYLDKSLIDSGDNVQIIDDTLNGTKLTLEFERYDLSRFDYTWMLDFIGLINRDVTFSYNGEVVNKIIPDISAIKTLAVHTVPNNNYAYGSVIVRVNGLPTFSKSAYYDCNVLYDVSCSVSPYHPDYILTSNRDNFRDDTIESETLSTILKLISDARAEKIASEKLSKFKPKSSGKVVINNTYEEYFILGEFQDSNPLKTYVGILATYKRYILQIAEFTGNDASKFRFGIVNETDSNGSVRACYSDNGEFHVFCVNPLLTTKNRKHEILASALHEFSHYLESDSTGHDVYYASRLTRLTSTILERVIDKSFRL